MVAANRQSVPDWEIDVSPKTLMLGPARCVLSGLTAASRACRRPSSRLQSTLAEVDSTGIPLKPTWSVNELLSSYPRPTITPATLKRLHELSALIPPTEGTPEHAKLTGEMEELVKLVEAVKLIDTSKETEDGSVPDGRIWAEGEGMTLEPHGDAVPVDGRSLLMHSSRTLEGLYVVEADKPRG